VSGSAPSDPHRGRLTRVVAVAAVLVLAWAALIGVMWLAGRSHGSEQSRTAAPLRSGHDVGGDSHRGAVPERPTRSGPAQVAEPAPSQVDAERPQLLQLPSGTAMPIETAATNGAGELVLPTDINRAGWWDGSSRLGDPYGSVVLAAHIDSFAQGLGRFAELLDIRTGDSLVISSGRLTQEYRVVSAQLVAKSDLSVASPIYAPTGDPRLVLITCGGTYDASRGGYQDNLVVEAAPATALERR
jgi:LPXTG-site transpeptidase (sortase) family protein